MLGIAKRSFDGVPRLLGDEIPIIKSFSEYDTGWVGDAIRELADAWVPTQTYEIWEKAPLIYGYIEDCVEEFGLINGDLLRTLQLGFFKYYVDLLEENMRDILFNRSVDYLNAHIESSYCCPITIDAILDDVVDMLDDVADSVGELDELESEVITGFYELYNQEINEKEGEKK